jgi:hypothetical protein
MNDPSDARHMNSSSIADPLAAGVFPNGSHPNEFPLFGVIDIPVW